MVADAFSPAARSPAAPAGRNGGAVLSRWSKMVLSSTPGGAGSNCAFTWPIVQDGQQVAIPDHAGAELLGGAGIGVEQFRAVRRGSHHAAMQQAWESEIGGVFSDRKSTRLKSSHLGISYAV